MKYYIKNIDNLFSFFYFPKACWGLQKTGWHSTGTIQTKCDIPENIHTPAIWTSSPLNTPLEIQFLVPFLLEFSHPSDPPLEYYGYLLDPHNFGIYKILPVYKTNEKPSTVHLGLLEWKIANHFAFQEKLIICEMITSQPKTLIQVLIIPVVRSPIWLFVE